MWCWRRLLRVPWTAKRTNQSILKEISPEYSLERLTLKLKFQYWPPVVKNWLIGKDPDTRKDWRQEEKGMTEDEMVGGHHQLSGHKFEQDSGDGDGQGSLACCSPWGHKELDMTERLNWILLMHWELFVSLSPRILALGLFVILIKISTQSYKLVRTPRIVLCGHFYAYFPYYE